MDWNDRGTSRGDWEELVVGLCRREWANVSQRWGVLVANSRALESDGEWL